MNNYPTLVRQRTPTTCGQCVIAMLYSISRSDAIDLIGHGDVTSDREILKQCNTKNEFVEGSPSVGVVAIQKHRDPNSDREHWTLWWNDRVLDPRNKVEDLWPVTKHVVIDWAHSTIRLPLINRPYPALPLGNQK